MFLTCLFIVCVIALIFGLYFWIRYQGNFAKKLTIWALIAAFLVGGTLGLVKNSCETNAANLTETYNELEMYHQTVTNSSNEYIRNHYYNEVQEYNKSYEESLKKSSNIFYSGLYPKDTFKKISTIDFKLKGDTP